MVLTSFAFLIFLLVLFILYYVLPIKIRWCVLLAGSIAFYLYAGVGYAVFILLTIISTYLGAMYIGKLHRQQDETPAIDRDQRKQIAKRFDRRRKSIVIITLVINLGILIVLKYYDFIALNFNHLFDAFSSSSKLPLFHFILPLGISFYTFQSIGYLIDVYRGICKPQRNLAKFALFAAYFPSVSQGPINRYSDLGKELFEPHKFDYQNVTFGVQRMLWGFFKKLVIADRIAALVGTIYGSYQDYPGAYVIIGTICFAFQLYTDFSGCMDIVIGASEIFGVKITENFRTPFFSRSISEYWRRWHITLGSWLKDYLFYPVLKSSLLQGINKKLQKKIKKKTAKSITTYIGMFILWFLIGLWHGADWSFIIGTGLLHWLYIVLGEVCKPLTDKIIKVLKINTACFSWRLFQQFRTFTLVCVGFVFFRASRAMAAIKMLLSVITEFNPWVFFDFSWLELGLDWKDFAVITISLLLLLVVSILQQKYQIRKKIAQQNLIFRWLVWLSLFFAVIIFGIYGPGYDATDFIYQQF